MPRLRRDRSDMKIGTFEKKHGLPPEQSGTKKVEISDWMQNLKPSEKTGRNDRYVCKLERFFAKLH